MREFEFIEQLLAPLTASTPEARGLRDDAAVISVPPGQDLVLTKDMMAAGVHFLEDDPPESIAAKLLRVNLSDLAAMGAEPYGVLLGMGLSPNIGEDWLKRFVKGLELDLAYFRVRLLGGDTISKLDRLTLSLTALGTTPADSAISRFGAKAGDLIYVTGTIGDAGLGLQVLKGNLPAFAQGADFLVERYRLPEPRLAVGFAMRGKAHACADVSDGLIVDARRIADASGLRAVLDLTDLPLSESAMAWAGTSNERRLDLASSGDDYELVIAINPASASDFLTLCKHLSVRLTCIGRFEKGRGVCVLGAGGVVLPVTYQGYEHR